MGARRRPGSVGSAGGAVVLALGAHSAGCAAGRAQASPPLTVGLYVAGDEARSARWAQALGPRVDAAVTLREAAPTEEPPAAEREDAASIARVAGSIAAAQRSFLRAEFAACLEALGPEGALDGVLAAGRRDLVARETLLRAACLAADERVDEARRAARALGVRGLELASVLTRPDLEALVAEALREGASSGASRVRVETTSPGAAVALDGRAPSCVSPCAVDAVAGEHVVRAELDGYEPAWRRARFEGAEQSVRIELAPASPERAARQWALRRARGEGLDDAVGAHLLSVAARSPRLALFETRVGARAEGVLRGALVLDGALVARAEHRTTGEPTDDDAGRLLRELLVRGRVLAEPLPVYRSPWFWTGVAAAAVTAATVTAVALTRPIETRVVLGAP